MKIKIITYKGKTLSITRWAKLLKINKNTLASRFFASWSVKKAFETPPIHNRKRCKKLSKDKIREIKELYIQGYSHREIATMFDKDRTTISYHTRELTRGNTQKLEPLTIEKTKKNERRYKSPKPTKTYAEYLEDEENRRLKQLLNNGKTN